MMSWKCKHVDYIIFGSTVTCINYTYMIYRAHAEDAKTRRRESGVLKVKYRAFWS